MTQTLRIGTARFMIRPWGNDPGAAAVGVARPGSAVGVREVHQMVSRLADSGVHHLVTTALGPGDSHVFRKAGFEDIEQLTVLRHDLAGSPSRWREAVSAVRDAAVPVGIRKGRNSHRGSVLEVDRAAFGGYWTMGAAGLDDALTATRTVRLRLAVGTRITGFSVCGKSARTGFLQRLAVDPRAQGSGIGRALVADALLWMRRRRATSLLVNTPVDNAIALHLYDSLGFHRELDGLTVLEHLGS
ncbi:MAG: GNAT family N-acetyltransferase [Microthrixaceae bacterium]